MPEVELQIHILNVSYVFRGFSAISDLKEFCDERCSESYDGTGPCLPDIPPAATSPAESSMLRPDSPGNGEDAPGADSEQCQGGGLQSPSEEAIT